MEGRRLAVVGSRDYHDYQQFCKMITYLDGKYNILKDVTEIVSGGAKGIDNLAEQWVKDMNKRSNPPIEERINDKCGNIGNTLVEQKTEDKSNTVNLITPQYKMTIFAADWSRGKSAGPIRNQKIIDYSDIIIAFPKGESRGTRNSIAKAEKFGKTCYIIEL